jgi:hypothetical protein
MSHPWVQSQRPFCGAVTCLSVRIKNTKELARPCKNHYAILDSLHGRRFLAHCFLYSVKSTAAVLLYWQRQTGERIGQHRNQRFLTVLNSTSSVSQSGPSRTPWSKSEILHAAVCQSGTSR